jgi:excisionase family DNA binding protein
MSKDGLQLTPNEIAAAFSDPRWADQFPPILTVDQAAELAVVPKATIYAWSSAGHLRACSRKVGKHLRIFRNRFVERLFNEGILDEKR